MALTEKQVIGRIEILDDGQIQVRTDTIIERDGVEIHRTYHREVLEPGQDVTNMDVRIQSAASAFWDTATIEAFQTKKAASLNGS